MSEYGAVRSPQELVEAHLDGRFREAVQGLKGKLGAWVPSSRSLALRAETHLDRAIAHRVLAAFGFHGWHVDILGGTDEQLHVRVCLRDPDTSAADRLALELTSELRARCADVEAEVWGAPDGLFILSIRRASAGDEPPPAMQSVPAPLFELRRLFFALFPHCAPAREAP